MRKPMCAFSTETPVHIYAGEQEKFLAGISIECKMFVCV
jgi:hypothetical protein